MKPLTSFASCWFIAWLLGVSATSVAGTGTGTGTGTAKVRARGRGRDKHAATCVLHVPDLQLLQGEQVQGGVRDPVSTLSSETQVLPCMIALYSVWHSFDFREAPVVIINSTLCSSVTRRLDFQAPTVAVVARGDCTFDQKTQHATDAGFAALVIVNTDDEPFLFGDAHSKQVEGVPTVMVGSSFWKGDLEGLSLCSSNGVCPHLSMDLSYLSQEKPRPQPVNISDLSPLAEWIPLMGFICLGGATLAILGSGIKANFVKISSIAKVHQQEHTSQSWWAFLFCLLTILIFSFACGAVTLRKRVVMDSDKFLLNDISYIGKFGNKNVTYNHRETDELIFETLTATISKNFWDYSLQSSGVIDTFQLSKENYDDDIFIHPPFFVYSMYAMLHFCGIPLVMASVVFHTLTAALIAPLALGLHSALKPHGQSIPSTSDSAYSSALWATIIFVTCPIARISSQKIWIDNAAVFTATLSAVFHIYSLRNSRRLTNASVNYRSLFSGMLFGLVALNCKITSLAMLPFLLSWTVVVSIFSHPRAASSSFLSAGHLGKGITNCCYLVFGVVCGHGPWIYLYHSFTGRLLPNAWPSKKMIEQSLYLQKAMDRNIAAYAIDLFKFSPLQLVGLIFGLGALAFLIYNICHLLRRFGIEGQTQIKSLCTEANLNRVALASFALWPLGFVGGLTLIGGIGGGFQIRFIVPILPATSVLASIAVVSSNDIFQPLVALLLVYGGMHCLFYSILYSPMFADMHASIFDVIRIILESPYEVPNGDIKFMKHFGLKLD